MWSVALPFFPSLGARSLEDASEPREDYGLRLGWCLIIHFWSWDIEWQCPAGDLFSIEACQTTKAALRRWNELIYFSFELLGSASILRHQICSLCYLGYFFLPSACLKTAVANAILNYVLLLREHETRFREDQLNLQLLSLLDLKRHVPESGL